MKILIAICFLLFSLVASSQPVINRGTTAVTVQDYRLLVKGNLFIPRYIDTTTANLDLGVDSCAALIFTYDVMSLWVRKCSPKRWERTGTSTFSGLTDVLISKQITNASVVFQNGYYRIKNAAYKDTAQISMSGVTVLRAYGDSWTSGAFADGPAIFPQRVADTFSLSISNRGVSAAGMYEVVNRILDDNPVSATRVDLVTILVGDGDVFACDATQRARNKMYGLALTAITNLFIRTATPMSDAAVTKSGFSNTTLSCQSKATTIGGSVQISTASGSTASFSATLAAGETLVIGTYSSIPGTIIGGFNVVIDGVNPPSSSKYVAWDGSEMFSTYGTYVPTGESGLTIYPNTIVIRGLSAATHTVVITTTSTSNTYIDYFGILAAPSAAKPVVVVALPHIDVGIVPGFINAMKPRHNDYADVMSTCQRDAVEVFSDYPISFVDPNDYWNAPVQLLHPDNIHPKSATGDDAIAKAIIDGIRFRTRAKMEFRTPEIYPLTPLAYNNLSGELTLGTVPVTKGGTGLATTTAYAVFTGGTTATGNFQQVSGLGTSGYVLTSNGAGALPTWQASAGGGGTPAGNYGDLQLNRNSAFATPASDSLIYTTALGLFVNNRFQAKMGAGGYVTINDGGLGTPYMGVWFAQTPTINSAGIWSDGSVLISDVPTGGYLSDRVQNAEITHTTVTGMFIGGSTSPTSTLHVGGSFASSYVAKTGTYTASATDYTIDCTSGTFTVNLPTAVGITGRIYVVKNSGAGTITIDGNASETIDGATTQAISVQYKSFTIQSNGANWIIIALT